jgi:DNA primase catalytic subunit
VTRYVLPRGMRYATLSERESFYSTEFDLRRVDEWFGWKEAGWRVVFAVIIGRHTKVFPEKYAEDADTTILIDEYKGLGDVRAEVLEFLPESVYYDRNLYDGEGRILGQELAFDVDPENFECPVHGTLADKMHRRQGLGFCKLEMELARDKAMRLYERLGRLFSEMRAVYSGRGFHIHVLDKEAFFWSRQKRRMLAREVKSEGFHVDEWVTAGGMRLIRLPYSLHGMVSRIVFPLNVDELARFSPVVDKRCMPKFLRKKP